MLNFEYLEKVLGIVSLPYFVYDFSRKMFRCYIQLTDQISLSDCLSFLRSLIKRQTSDTSSDNE